MNIHGMLLVKNEADILEASLIAASKWCDFIYVFDNGSTDRSWEIAQALSRLYPQIIPFKQDGKPFTQGLRSQIFNHFFNRAQPGDWWAKVDADEFYIENPQTFLAKVPPQHKVVVSASLSYYFTDVDAERYSEEPARYADEVPVEEKIRYYLSHWSEPRFMRHEPHLVWKNGTNQVWPSPFGSTYPVRIMLKHFAYRSPQQIERRLRDRIAAMSLGSFSHEAMKDWGQTVGNFRTNRRPGLSHFGKEYATTDWRTRIVPADGLDYDDHTGKYVINESLMPPIDMHWTSRPIGDLPRLLPGLVSRKLKKAVQSVFPFSAYLNHLTAKKLSR